MPQETNNQEELGKDYMKFVGEKWGHGNYNKVPTLYTDHIEIAKWWLDKLASHTAKAVEGEKNKIRKAITLIQEYPQEVFHMYEGKLPWVIFEGRADEREKRAIYEAAFRDFTGLLKRFLEPHTDTT